MDLDNKNILILGLGISGVSTVRALNKLGAKIFISDSKKEEDLQEYIDQIKDMYIELYLGTNDVSLKNMDLIIKSPGIPVTLDIIERANEEGIEVITDLELAYRIKPKGNLIAITGTNGKTTTTSLVGEFFKKAGITTHIAGNIGVGILWDIVNSKQEDVFVIEASSFQLESTKHFNPKVSTILNITPDHLNWHKTLDNYIAAKKKIFKNQDEKGYTILNYDDPLLRSLKDEVNSGLIWFSVDNRLDRGIYIEDGDIVINDGSNIKKVLKIHELKLLGKHNLENILAAISIAWVMGLDTDTMGRVLKIFPGVEHRIEYVDEINGIKFYNDSKGTNQEASIKAIEAVEPPIILIGGGQDKGSEFDDMILSFKDRVKALVLLGETKEKISDTAIKHGFNNIHMANNMKEAVEKSYELGKIGDSILLSPACASWDMYKSFEIRGNDFKEAVSCLREE